MSRLCERPGCSDAAAVAYGMRTEDLVFWLDALDDRVEPPSGVLCRRHGDGMVVPRGWTLDDLRDPDLHLFRPPTADGRTTSRTTRRRPVASTGDAEQLALAGVQPSAEPSPPEPSPPETVSTGEVIVEQEATTIDPESADAPWRPAFDTDDDLNGLLAARSPLLSRAFRGTDRSD